MEIEQQAIRTSGKNWIKFWTANPNTINLKHQTNAVEVVNQSKFQTTVIKWLDAKKDFYGDFHIKNYRAFKTFYIKNPKGIKKNSSYIISYRTDGPLYLFRHLVISKKFYKISKKGRHVDIMASGAAHSELTRFPNPDTGVRTNPHKVTVLT